MVLQREDKVTPEEVLVHLESLEQTRADNANMAKAAVTAIGTKHGPWAGVRTEEPRPTQVTVVTAGPLITRRASWRENRNSSSPL